MSRSSAARRLVAAALAAALVVPAGRAAAQPHDALAPDPAEPPAGQTPPWHHPPDDERLRARELFREGNTLIRDSLFPGAVERYRDALTHWDHPAIHFNLALALVNLDQPIEVHAHLRKAMAYGPAPLGQEKFELARTYLALVEQQLATVELTVDEPGARLIVDGKEVFVGPGTWRSLVRAGEHHVRATSDQGGRADLTLRLAGGETHTQKVVLHEIIYDDFGHRDPLPTWIPPTLLLGGVMLGAMGGVFHHQGKLASQDYAEQLAACLPMDPGCSTRPALVDVRNAASSHRIAAFTLYGAGAATLALGVILLRLNRTRYHRSTPTATA